MKIHDIKIQSGFADAVFSGEKPFELRRDDRDYQTGDLLRFHVIDIDGKEASAHPLHMKSYRITYVLHGYGLYGLQCGFVCLGIAPDGGKDGHFG